MPHQAHPYVILLRAIGPATHRLMGMAQWREAAEAAGFMAPETVLNTGNMVADFAGDATATRQAMRVVLRGFGLGENVAPIVRRPALLETLIAADPIAAAARDRPAETAVFFFGSDKPDFAWLGDHDGPEKTHVVSDHLIVDFTRDVAKSSRLIRLIDKHCGLNTARSWSSMGKVAAKARDRATRQNTNAASGAE